MTDRLRRATVAAAAASVLLGGANYVSAFGAIAPATRTGTRSSSSLTPTAAHRQADVSSPTSEAGISEFIYTERRRQLLESDAVFGMDLGEIEDFDDEDEGDEGDFLSSMGSFQDLQRSTGSEVLDYDLQQQIERASARPQTFLDSHVADATPMERIAMASIPEQLPKPAVDAFSTANNNAKNNKKKQTRNVPVGVNGKLSAKTINERKKQFSLNYSHKRVTPEQERQLGALIQRGAKLHKLRSDFEDKHGRTITRQEWTELAGLESPKELRRHVSEYRRAKQLLVAANMGLVHSVVRSQYGTSKGRSGLSMDDIIQEGTLGLLRAAELFDPTKGIRFSTYATIWIKGSLSNTHAEETIKLPLRERNKWNKIRKAHEALVAERAEAGEPTVEELANHVGMSVADVVSTQRKMAQTKKIFSLDYQYNSQSRSGDESGSLLNALEKDKALQDDADMALRAQMHSDIVAALARNLDPREARLMRLKYGLADGRVRTTTECAEAMGISQGLASRLDNRCLKKLREAQDVESLEEYLLTIV